MRRRIWRTTSAQGRRDLLEGRALTVPLEVVADNLAKALIFERTPGARGALRRTEAILRGFAIAVLGRVDAEIGVFIDSQPRARG